MRLSNVTGRGSPKVIYTYIEINTIQYTSNISLKCSTKEFSMLIVHGLLGFITSNPTKTVALQKERIHQQEAWNSQRG